MGTLDDMTAELSEMTELIEIGINTWQEFGYETPPTPDAAAIPPLGKRSAEAITGVHATINTIDNMTRKLNELRNRLIDEHRQDSDIRGAQVDAMLAARRQEREAKPPEADAEQPMAPGKPVRVLVGEHQGLVGLIVEFEPTTGRLKLNLGNGIGVVDLVGPNTQGIDPNEYPDDAKDLKAAELRGLHI